ncbi:CAP-associated domain-containing protein [Bacillus sp. T3]|uniref:CAP domain-containing protein n=1 Tax=Bacillus sp. T3 TaxID=467262 RepID=UPI0029823FF9|nr:CAP-associated domain-containing protein [Bacillus sp. T3]
MTLGSSKDTVRKQLGEPLSKLEKGTVYFQFDKKRDYDVYHLDGSYITFFYDKHEHNTVTAVQIINEKVEQSKQDFYASESTQLREGFEYQLFDLTNATRVKFGLPVLTWNANVTGTAREHSLDMAENHYFDHQNLKGQSPFDRMKEDEVVFTSAGENLAYEQFSSIFAHEGLMNSLGHRENILRTEYEFLGVGVAFNTEAQPYYTENFFAN